MPLRSNECRCDAMQASWTNWRKTCDPIVVSRLAVIADVVAGDEGFGTANAYADGRCRASPSVSISRGMEPATIVVVPLGQDIADEYGAQNYSFRTALPKLYSFDMPFIRRNFDCCKVIRRMYICSFLINRRF